MYQKWNCCYRLGLFVGFTKDNSLLVANMRNLQTGYVPPQYHCVFEICLKLSLIPNRTLTRLIRVLMRYSMISAIGMMKKSMRMAS